MSMVLVQRSQGDGYDGPWRLWSQGMGKLKNVEALFKGRHFDREVIILCVRWYLRFKLSFRDLVEIMAANVGCRSRTPRLCAGFCTLHHSLSGVGSGSAGRWVLRGVSMRPT
jgi:hypothetical protein